MWMTISSPSCLWKRTWVKNSRVPWSPKAPNASASAASGPEHASTWSASTVTVQEATQGVPATIRSQRSSIASMRRYAAAVLLVEGEAEVGLVVQAVEALDDGLLDLLDRLDGLAGVRVDLEHALVVDLDLEVLRPAAVAAQPARRGADRILVLIPPCAHYPPRGAQASVHSREAAPRRRPGRARRLRGLRRRGRSQADLGGREGRRRDRRDARARDRGARLQGVCERVFTKAAREQAGGADCPRC